MYMSWVVMPSRIAAGSAASSGFCRRIRATTSSAMTWRRSGSKTSGAKATLGSVSSRSPEVEDADREQREQDVGDLDPEEVRARPVEVQAMAQALAVPRGWRCLDGPTG